MQPIDRPLRQIADLFLMAILFAPVLVNVFSRQTMMIKFWPLTIDRPNRSPSLNYSFSAASIDRVHRDFTDRLDPHW